MMYFCSNKNRRALVLQHRTLNGIDYLEVETDADNCVKRLLITLLKPVGNISLIPSQVRITGGSSTAQVHAVSILAIGDGTPRVLAVELDRSGDFSTYTLSLVADSSTSDPPQGFDPQLSTVDFSFKAGCPTVGDCLPSICCPSNQVVAPDINYLAKDYDSFRQAMLDRMAVLTPAWKESHPSDIGMAMVEVLAYAADHLSYQQDAVGTEAYLGTARSRISLRRHAKLMDYRIGEGSNARVWVYINVLKDGITIPSGTLIVPRISGFPTTIQANSLQAQQILNSSAVVFATMQETTLYQKLNEIQFYTWSDSSCCLATGATEATLLGQLTALQPGDVLVFEEVKGPLTGNRIDADPTKRWAVRLTNVQTMDYWNRPLVDPVTTNLQPITKVWWAAEDALPFPLCISGITDAEHGSTPLSDVSVARGNIIPADHGVWQDWEDLGQVPGAPLPPVMETSCVCGQQETLPEPRPRYFPQLSKSPITFAYPSDTSIHVALRGTVALTNGASKITGMDTFFTTDAKIGQWLIVASDVIHTPYQISQILNDTSLTLVSNFMGPSTPSTTATIIATASASAFAASPSNHISPALAQIHVRDDQGQDWTVLDDLLSSDDSRRACVLEIERDGTAFVRFGDGQYGMAPKEGTHFSVHYRVGNGSIGNIGHDTLAHVLTNEAGIVDVRNPLPAAGGMDSETMEHIRRTAPFAFRTQLRAVTEDDYGVMAQRDPAVREARGTLRWTGSWYTAFTSVETQSGSSLDAALLTRTKQRLNLARMAGVDLEVEGAVIVGLRIEMTICVAADHFQSDVGDAIMRLFTIGDLCDGRRGILNPENFTFGQTIYTSPFIAAAQGVEGMTSATMMVFQRMDNPTSDGVALGYLTMGRLEIARCDNDPNRLDHGIFVLHMNGGK